MKKLAVFTILTLSCLSAWAHEPVTQAPTPKPAETTDEHSGGTNAYGCHTNHKTGVYHCH